MAQVSKGRMSVLQTAKNPSLFGMRTMYVIDGSPLSLDRELRRLVQFEAVHFVCIFDSDFCCGDRGAHSCSIHSIWVFLHRLDRCLGRCHCHSRIHLASPPRGNEPRLLGYTESQPDWRRRRSHPFSSPWCSPSSFLQFGFFLSQRSPAFGSLFHLLVYPFHQLFSF